MNTDGKWQPRITSNTALDYRPDWRKEASTPPVVIMSPYRGETWQRGTNHGDPGLYRQSESHVKITRLQTGIEVGTIAASTSISGLAVVPSYGQCILPD